MNNLKLFSVTLTESGWGYSKEIWTKHFLVSDKDVLLEILNSRYGQFPKYYRYDEGQEDLTITELDYETITISHSRSNNDDEY